MIGKLTGNGWTAEMGDDGKWTATDPAIQTILSKRYRAGGSPSLGAFGRNAMLRAADDFRAEVEFPELANDDKDDAKVY